MATSTGYRPMRTYDEANLALKAVCPNNELLYDNVGLPSVMVKIPKMTYADLGLGNSTATFPAFLVNGQEVSEIYISKYMNIIQNGRAYSLPGQDPANTINFDNALKACNDKGAGWHLMTRMEWMALAHWCKNNGTMPKGNNNYGKDTSETVYKAIPSMARGSSNRIQRVATGTGPLAWSHDGTPSGIWDLNGNVSEWVGGVRTVYGEIQVLANNNAADGENPQTAASTLWKAIKGSDGTLITPQGDGRTSGSVKLSWDGSKWTLTTSDHAADTTYHGCALESIVCDASIDDSAKPLLQALGFFKYDATAGAYGGDYVYADVTQAERSFICGGYWSNGANAGVFCLSGYYGRSYTNTGIGFRSAFVVL